MATANDAKRLVRYINSLEDFEVFEKADGAYDHIGATLADAALQARNNYERNVRPRVDRIRRRYAEHATREALERLLTTVSVQTFLSWNGKQKPMVFERMISLLKGEKVNTETEFKVWLQLPDSPAKLDAIPFVGPKTIDYLKILVGLQTVAIDSHLLRFIAQAGIKVRDYREAHALMLATARLLRLKPALMDHSVWRYMTRNNLVKLSRARSLSCQ